jgi:hypothetical protein
MFRETRCKGRRVIHRDTNDTRKGASNDNGKVFRETRVKGEAVHIETQNDTRKGASNFNGKVFRETRVKERRGIHSDTE